jgi:hypothetical protein
MGSNDKGQRTTRTRSATHAARQNKGHPLRTARRQRAQQRLALHVYDSEKCGENCPKKNSR